MEDWCTFTVDQQHRCPIEWPSEVERECLLSSLIKKVLFVLVICDKRDWKSVCIETSETKNCVTLVWQKPYRLQLCLYDDDRNMLSTGYEPIARHFEMDQLEGALVRCVSRESSLENMRNQFCVLFDTK